MVLGLIENAPFDISENSAEAIRVELFKKQVLFFSSSLYDKRCEILTTARFSFVSSTVSAYFDDTFSI